MTFLSKLGAIINEGLKIFGILAPVAQVLLPGQAQEIQTISNDLTQVAGVIVQVEAVGQALSLPGAQKLTAAVGPVSNIILNSALMVNKKIANPDLFKQGATKIADGMADILNSLHADVETTSKS